MLGTAREVLDQQVDQDQEGEEATARRRHRCPPRAAWTTRSSLVSLAPAADHAQQPTPLM